MIFSSLREGSSAPDDVVCRRRQDILLNSKANGSVIQVLNNNNNNNINDHEEDQDNIHDAKKTSSNTKSLRRKRRELHRIKTLESNGGDRSISYDHDGFVKRKRLTSEIEQTEAKLAYVPGDYVVGSRSESHGVISIIGRRREMEDAVAVELGFLERPGGGGGRFYDFFGVYDGHGGWRVAEACGKRLHRLLVELIVAREGDLHQSGGGGGEWNMMIDWEKVMVDGFRKMDEEVNRHGGAAVATTGSTAVVAVVGEDQLVVANCGDSRAVLSRCGVAVQVSDDHKPDRPDELKRIEVSGGRVINWNGQRVLGVLATSRSIGDYYLKPFVVPVPEVRVINRTDTDEFLILASDGLWDVISNDVACQMVRKCFEGRTRNNPQNQKQDNGESRAVEAAAVLAELAIARGSRDNVSVIVLELN